MDTLEAIRSRRSIRTYQDQGVPGELVDQLLAAAMSAPQRGTSSLGNLSWSTTAGCWPRSLASIPTPAWLRRRRWAS